MRRTALKRVWTIVCTLLGAFIGAVLLNFLEDSAFLTVGGTLAGAGIGYVIGRYVPILSVLSELLN